MKFDQIPDIGFAMAHYNNDYKAHYGRTPKKTVEIAYINSGDVSIRLYKKELIAKSAKILFDKDDIPLTIRVAQSGDVVEQPTVAPAQTPRQVEVKPQAQEQQVKVQNSQSIKKDVVQENVKDAKEIERMETDQEKMVLDLFDGKYVE
jgi:hypothetical protein